MTTSHRPSSTSRYLEIACFTVESAIIAAEAGADRIELCAGEPSAGGLTPSLSDLQEVKDTTDLPVHVMIRPRAGNFVYNDEEIATMKTSIIELRVLADGYVFGSLDSDCKIDVLRCNELLDLAGPKPCVFHRAIGEVPDLPEAMEQIIRLGFHGVLTSGRQATAVQGAGELRNIIDKFGKQVQVIVGGGVRASTVDILIAETGATWYHSSALIDGWNLANATEIANMLKRIKHKD
jgi:copper homeostasis protein